MRSFEGGPLAMAAAAGTGVQVGAAIVATRFVIPETDPATLALLRYAIGFLCLLPPLLASGRGLRFERRDILPLAALGIAQFGILVTLLNFGLTYIPSGRAALIFTSFPLQTLVLGALLGRERLTAPKLAGVLLTVMGVGLALGEKAVEGGGAREWLGEAAVIASAFSGALCSVLYRPYLGKYPTLPVSAFAMLASVGFLAMVALAVGSPGSILHLSARGWAAVVFIGLSSGVGYVLWLWALARASATEVTVFLALSPVTAALLGALLAGEPITALASLGIACVALGLWLATRGASRT